MIPFNKPHGFRIVEIGDYHIKLQLPYKRRNLNHIRGLHACALATLSEFTTGLLLISKLGFDTYRIIYNACEMDYHYQARWMLLPILRYLKPGYSKTFMSP